MSLLARLAGLGIAALLVAAGCSQGSEVVDHDLAGAVARAAPGAEIEVRPGAYPGPIVIDKPISIIGGPGVVVLAPEDGFGLDIVATSDVSVRDVAVHGGHSGVRVRDSIGVTLDGLTTTGATWHGIYVSDSEVAISDCTVAGLRNELGQGVEIINSDSRPPSLVKGCHIQGPVYEGLVVHATHVAFEDNTVTGSIERGIVITEMSDGRMEGNRVTDAIGSAFFCGDMSRCSIVDNTAVGVASQDSGFLSADGHGVVVWFHSQAYVDRFNGEEITGESILVLIDSELVEESLYP